MINKKKILILGGGHEQLPGIIISKSMGIRNVVIDKNNKCPGRKYSNKFYNISTDNFKRILQISKKENIDGICTFASERPLKVISKICEIINLKSLKENIIEKVTNKDKSKKIFKKKKISFINGVTFNFQNRKKIKNYLKLKKKKYVIKPSNSFGQNGISMIKEKNNLQKKIDKAFRYSSEKKIIIEDYEKGNEINVVGIVENKKLKILSISQRYTNHELGFGIAFKHVYSSISQKEKIKKLEKISQKIIKNFKINDTVIYFQFLNNKKTFKVIEIAVRTPGGFMYELSNFASGYDIVKFTILKSLGIKNALSQSKSNVRKYDNLIIKFLTKYDFFGKKRLNLKKRYLNNSRGYVDLIMHSNKLKKLKNSGGRIGGLFVTGKNTKICKQNLNNIIEKFKLYKDEKFF